MKALVLAADSSENMKPLTLDLPKSELEVSESILLERTLRRIEQAGCSEAIIAVNNSSNQVINAVSAMSFESLVCSFSIESEPLENGGRLLQARDLLGEEPFLLVDIAISTDLEFSELVCKGVPDNKLARLVFVPKAAHHAKEYFSLSKGGGLSFTFDETFSGDEVTFSGIGMIDPYLIDRYAPDFAQFPLISLLAPAIHQGLACGELYDRA